MLERTLQFEASTTHITKVVSQNANLGIGRNSRARFFQLLFVDEYPTGKNKGLRALPRWNETALEQKFIEPLFQAESE